MSTHTATGTAYATGPGTLYTDVVTTLREPTAVSFDGTTTTFTFLPDLTAAEATTFSDLVGLHRQREAVITVAEFGAIRSQIAELRTFRTRTLAQWNALTAGQREADEISYLNDLTDVLRALLRQ